MQIQRHLFKWILYCFLCWTTGLVQAQIPTLTNETPIEGFIGEQVCFPVTFVNTGAPGFIPYIRLVLPAGVSFDNSSFSGAVQTVQNLGLIAAGAPNNFVIDPVAQANGNSTSNDTIFAPVGSTVIILEYPVGSMVQGGVSLISEVCVTIDAGATVGVPVDICTQGMYAFGDTPTGNNGSIAGANGCEPITPILFRFDKKINGSDGVYNEVPGGGGSLCHVHQYQFNVDIAAAGTLNGPITITDVLPGTLTYLGNISLPAGCSAVEPTVGGLGGSLTVTCNGAYPGSTANIDLQVTFDAAISDTLDETICDDLDIINNASIAVPGSPSQSDSVATHVEHVLLGHGNNAAGPVTIGQTVMYTISAEITEYTAGLNAASITFIVPDGMVYNPASLTWAGAPVLVGNVIVLAGPGTGSTVTVDVHTQSGANILPCGSPALQYTADVNQTYSNGDAVLSRDSLRHRSTLTYDLVEGASGCTTSADSYIEIVDIFFQKTVVNSPPTGPGRNGSWWPGDTIQYRLELQVPSLDLDDVVITDFFPLPVHDVTDLAVSFGTDVRFDPATCWINAPVSYIRDAATNSLILDFGDVSNSITGGCVDIILLIDIPITTVPFADGLFHSNFMQVNSDNSTGDDITGNSLTLVQIGAPDLDLTKGIVSSNNPNVTISPVVVPPNGNATDISAGDQLFFDITVENTGTAPGYDVQIRDVAPPELTNCVLVAPNPVVDGSNNALAFSGGFAGNTLTIDLIAPNDSIAFIGTPNGNDLITVSYVCEAVAGIQAGTQFDNTAEVDWSSIRGGTKFPPVDDEASGVIADPTMTKVIDYIFPNYSNTNTQASIGEVVAYEVQLNIPEGNLNNVIMVDQVDEGLAFVGVDSILICNSSGNTNILTSIGGGFTAVQSGAAITSIGANPQQQDRVLTLDFGNLQNLDVDNIEDTIKIFYRTIVINHVTNVDGQRVRNRARVSWDNPNNPGGRTTINSRAPFVTIVEPEIEISKSFTPDEVLPGNNSFVTLTLRNLATSTAPAFDVSLTDILPTGMIFVSGFSAGGTASITTPPTNGGGTITAHWDTINVGEVYSITFEVQSSSSITPCFTLTNCANVTWESIAEADEPNMPSAFSSNLGIKRTGNPGNIGGVANTHTSDSCADLDVIIDNTFDPFITANTPLCEGDRVVLSVQQYQGNVVTYNWTGPGVPSGFNNYELVLDPITAADTGTYFVFVELDGCVTDTSNSFSLQLRPKPLTPNINPGDTTICEGTSIQFSTTSIENTYTWTGPNGFTANSATTPLISPVTLADAGRYTLFTTNSQGCNSDPISSNLMVTPRPAQPSLGNNTPICSNENIVFTSSVSATTYHWLSPNGQDTVTTTNTLILEPSNPFYTAGNWTLTVSDANGCASEASNITTVIINGTPVAPITSNSGPICEGDAVTLMVNTVSNGAYTWYSDATLTNLVASTQNPVINGLLAANSPDTFYVQVSSNGCLSDTGFTVVEINANPATVVPNYTPLCSGDTIFLFSNATASIYNWTGPNGFVSNLENPFIANSANSNAGSYTLSVTDANGCSNSGIVQVAVDERPATPSITSNTPVCAGDNIVLNVATYTGTTVQYTWSTPIGLITTGVPSLNVNNTTSADSGIYSVVVAVDGCISLADSINVIINSNPTAPNVPANFAVCEGDGITLSTTTNANVYNWTGPNGFASSSPNPPVISPATAANAGTYSLVIQDFNGCTSPVSSTVVTINPAPAQPAMTTNAAICMGDNLVLSTSSIATSYIWTAPNGADTTTTTSTVTISSTSSLYQSGNWNLVVVDASGCSSSASVPSNVVINTVPVTASAGNNGPVCSGSTVPLSAGSVSGASYAWYTDAATSNQFSSLQNPRVTNITSDSTFYLLVTINGCTSALDSTTVTVHPLTTAPALPADFAVCEGDNITLSTSTVASTYNWSGPNGFTSTQQNPVVINNATISNGGVYTLSIVDANGCSSADTSVTVTVNPAPAQPAVSTNATICTGDNLVLSTSSVATSYVWTAPNGADTTTTTNTVTILPTSSLYQSGNWSLVVVDANGCSSSASVPSNVVINTIPVTASAGNNGPVCSGSNAQLSAGSVSGASYAWYTDAATTNQFSTLQNPMLTSITSNSTFYLLVTINGCTSALDSTIVTVHPLTVAPALPANFTVCEGDNITLSTSTVASIYNWSGPNGFTSTQQNPVVINNAALSNGGIYTLSTVDANGCSSADTSVTVTVNPAPAQPAMSTNSAICTGDNLVLSSTAIATSYIWTAPNGADTTTATSTATIPSTSSLYQSGNWNLVVVDANGCSSEASIPSAVSINNGLTATAFNNGPVCSGDAVQLSTTTVSSALYEWYSDVALTNLISTQQNPTITNITTDSTFFLVVTVNGCASTPITTTVSLNPTPATASVPADFVVCEGETIALTTTTAAASYNWTGPNGFTSNLQNPAVIRPATTADAGVYTLSIVDANGCQSADTSVTVGVDIAPAAPVLTNNSAICDGDTLMLSTTAIADTFRWTSPNGIDTITTVSSLMIIPSNTTYYQSGNWTLITQIANNCPSQSSAASSVVINSTTTAPNVFNDGPVCVGGNVSLSTTSAPGASYQWYTDAALTNLIGTSPAFTVNNITTDSTFYLVVTVSGCISPAGSTLVTVISQPTAPAVPADFAVCEGDNIVLSTSTIANGYSWTGPNGFTSNLQTPTVITNASSVDAGGYKLVVTYSNGCISGDTIVQVTVNSNPPAPNIVSNGPLCFGDTLVLSSSTNCGQSQWIGPNGNSQSTLGTPGGGNLLWTLGSTTNIPVNDVNYLQGNWSMICIDTLTGCQTESNIIDVIINANPDTPNVFNDGPVCNGATANLTTATVAGGSYAWFSDAALSNLVATTQNPSIVNITNDTTWYLVVTVNGCSSIAGSTTVTVHPTPVTPNVPADFAVCTGDNITLTTTTVAGAYNWSGPNGFTSNVQNPVVIANATAANAGVYTLSIIDANGCLSGDTTVTISIDAIPVMPVLSSNSTICAGDSLILSTTAVATSYQWIAPNGATATTTIDTLGIDAANSLYQAGDWMLITTNAAGCTSMPSAVNNVIINNNPAQPAIFNDGPVCNGAMANLTTATVTGGIYAWFSDAALTNLVSTTQNPSIVNITSDTTWYLVVTLNGCSSVAGVTTVTVRPIPATPNVPADFAVCEGDNIILTTNTVAVGYNWSGPNGFTSNVQNPVVITNATATNAGVYTLSIIDRNGCVSGDTSVNVSVNGNPAPVTITSNSSICFGDTLTLTSSSYCGQSQWIGPNGNSASTLGTVGSGNVLWTIGSTTNIPSADANYLSGDWYMICIDTITGCRSESNTINVVIDPIPVVSAFNNGPICAGENGELSATFIAGASYNWYSDAALTTLVSTIRTPIISNMMASDSYYVVATVNGCTSLADSTTIVVNPTPVMPNPTYTPLCQLDTLFLQANAVGPIASYWWTGPNNFTSHLENPVIPNVYPFNAGSYIVTVTDSFGCQAVSTVEVTIYPKPQTPTIAHNAPFCEGTNDLTLSTQAYFGTDVRYIWTLPNGSTDTTLVPSLVLPNATVSDTGLYSLVIFVDGCLSLPGDAVIRIYPTPATPNVPANFAVCEGGDIMLTTTTVATGYFWSGPNGFTSNLPSPTVVSATLVDAGVYSLYVTNTWGCRSLDTTVQVTVNSNPPAATITGSSPICFGDTLTLTSSSNCGQSQWIGPNGTSASTLGTPGGGNVLWTIGGTTNIASTDVNYLPGDWYMICIDTITGCQSESNTITIDINPIPSTPAAFNNSPVCVGGTVQLSTTTVNNGTYAWYADSTLTTLVATSQNPIITNITTDSTFYIVVTVNGCSSLAGSTNVTVHPVPATPDVPANFAVCAGGNIILSTTSNAAAYIWTGPNGFSSTLQNPSVVNATLVDSGTYTLFIIDANGCPSGDTSVLVGVNPNPAQPVLSNNSAICDGDSLVLSTTATATTFMWIAPDGSDTLTTVSNLVVLSSSTFYQDGNWTLITIDANGCQSILSNPSAVIIHSIPAAQIVFNNGPVCSGSSVNLSTSFISGATYEWYSDAALTNLVATSQNPTINNITTDSTFYLVITVNGCTSAAGSTTVQVHPTPATPNVPANITACEGDALVLTTTTNASTYVWSGPNGFNSNQQSPTVINTASVVDSGTYTLYIIDANGCRSADTTVQVIVNPTPTTPFVVSNNTPVCEGDDIILSANAGVLGTTYEWFNSLNVSVGTGQTLTIAGATVANAGDYYVITTVNACPSAASTVTTAIVDPIPNTAAFAGSDIGLCNTFATNLDATPPSNAIGTWTTASGATIANPNLANTAIYNLPTGISTFYWTLSNGACADFSIDSMLVDVTPVSTDVANAGLDQNLCGQVGATLVATTPTTGTGQWTQSASQAGQGVVITNPTNPNTTVTGLQQGNNYLFTWTLSNGNCTDYSTDMVQINVDVAPPDNAYAGVNILLCNQNVANLDAFASQYGTGFWTSTSSATIIDPTLASTTVINLPQDTSVFVWTLSNGTCLNYSTDSVLVVVSSTTDTAEAGNNQVVCSVNALTLGATMPNAGIGTWSQTAAQAAQGVVLVDVNDPNTQVVGLNAGTTYAFTWTLTNGTCQDYSSDITTITVNATPPDNAFAGNDINLCGVTTTTNLAASVPTVAIGFWTTTSTATISNPTQPGSTVSGLVVGQNIFVWTLSNGTCQDYDNDTIIITVTTPSADIADAGLDSAYCAQSVVTLNAAAPSVGGGYWSQTPSQASLGSVIDNPTDTSSTVSNLMAGVTYTFTWTLTNGGCVDYSSDQVLITIDILPTNVAYAGADTILCGGNTVQLDGLAPPIGTGFWTTNDTATIVTPVDPTSLVVNIGQDTTLYYWTLSNGACVDYSIDSVTVIISPASTDLAFAGYDEILCVVDSITLSGGTPTTSTGIWTQSAGQSSQGIVITNPTDPNSTVTGIQTGQVYTFTWTLSTFGCANFSTDDVQYTINALPSEVAYAGPDIVLCSGNTVVMDATNPIFSTGVWSSNSTAIIVNPTLNNSSIVTIPTDTVAFYWALSNGSCIDYSIDTMLIIVTPTFSVDTANAGLDINLCNEDTAQLMAITPNVATGRWTQPFNQSSAGVVITNPNTALTTATGLQLDSSYTFTWSVSNGPCQDYDTDEMIVQVSALPTDAAYAGEDFVICGIDTAVVNATTPSIGTGLWTTASNAVIVTPPNTTTELLNLSIGANEFVWTLSNGACRDYSSDTIVITMDSAPIANADSFVVIYNSNGTTIDVTPNDNLNNNWVITISESIASGTLTNLGTGEFDLLLQDVLVDQSFIYQLCNPSCPAVYCDTALVIINVQGGTVCNFPNMITPNNDDANETFIVPCLDGLEGTKFAVYNRWGDSIYENDNYKNDWGGTHNGAPVPDATYFYIMELADGQRFQGFVEVRR
jgi:gliding motility-associated-like protein/fimbrial isopeptide formation D2 family protein/uncharacterized repeat protein (TIGR01451 family)